MTNDQASQAGQNAVNILVISTDLSLAKAVQSACQTVAGENTDKNYRVFPGLSKEKVIEALERYEFHSILVEEESLSDTTAELYLPTVLDLIRKRPENANTAVVLVTSKVETGHIRKMVKIGYRDVLIKPLDTSIFLQKMTMYNSVTPFLREPILFNMDFKKEIDVAFNFECTSLSEYGMEIASDSAIATGLVVGLSSPILDVSFSAVVMGCAKSGDKYVAQLMFIGVTAAETQAVRKIIRSEYADGKQAA